MLENIILDTGRFWIIHKSMYKFVKMGTPFSSLICSQSPVGSSTKIIELSSLFLFNDIIYSLSFALPVVFPEPMFPSIETIKHDDDGYDVFAHLENEAEAPIFVN